MMKRFVGALLAATLVLSVAGAALADNNVTNSVYGAPPCDQGVKLGNKHCRPADVAQGDFAANAITDVVSSGIMVGDSSGNFMPDKKLSNGEAVTIMLRVLGVPVAQDNGGNWAQPALDTAATLGLTSSTTQADVPMTRAGMALLIAKALKIQPSTDPVPFTDAQDQPAEVQQMLSALYKAGVFVGYPDHTFAPDRPLSRAEMALLVERILAKYKH